MTPSELLSAVDNALCRCGCKWVRHEGEVGGFCMDCRECGMFEDAEVIDADKA